MPRSLVPSFSRRAHVAHGDGLVRCQCERSCANALQDFALLARLILQVADQYHSHRQDPGSGHRAQGVGEYMARAACRDASAAGGVGVHQILRLSLARRGRIARHLLRCCGGNGWERWGSAWPPSCAHGPAHRRHGQGGWPRPSARYRRCTQWSAHRYPQSGTSVQQWRARLGAQRMDTIRKSAAPHSGLQRTCHCGFARIWRKSLIFARVVQGLVHHFVSGRWDRKIESGLAS